MRKRVSLEEVIIMNTNTKITLQELIRRKEQKYGRTQKELEKILRVHR